MNLIDQQDEQGNWWEVLRIWEKIANWTRFHPSDSEFRNQVKMLLVCLWNEKDWLITQYPEKRKQIEQFINGTKFIGITGDLANTIKHRKLTKPPRSRASQTEYYGRVTTGPGEARRMYFINDGKGGHPEIVQILRGTLDEFEILHHSLRSGKL